MASRKLATLGVGLALALLLGGSRAEAGRKPRTAYGKKKGSVVALVTTQGTIQIQLYLKKAPRTTANFLKYVASGFYNGTIFHRVIRNFMIQGGGLTKLLVKKKTLLPIPNEATNGLSNLRGTVAMARTSNPHSATAQFFINVVNNTFLDHKAPRGNLWGYCVFARVISGMDVVDKIRKVATRRVGGKANVPIRPVVIKRVYIVR